MVIFTEFLYVSVSGIILSIKQETIAYMTQLTSLNTCVLHHERIFYFHIYDEDFNGLSNNMLLVLGTKVLL